MPGRADRAAPRRRRLRRPSHGDNVDLHDAPSLILALAKHWSQAKTTPLRAGQSVRCF